MVRRNQNAMSRQRRLPPLLPSQNSVTDARCQLGTPNSQVNRYYLPSTISSSRYHNNCGPSTGSSRSPRPVISSEPTKTNKSTKSAKIMRSCSQDCIQRSASPKVVIEFLQDNPEFLEDYVLNHIDLELLERWIIRKSQRTHKRPQSAEVPNGRPPRKTSLSRWKFCVHADKRKMLQEMTNNLYLKPSKGHVLSELSETVASAVNADSWNLYIYDKSSQEIYTFGTEEKNPRRIQSGTTLAAFVANAKEAVRTKTDNQNPLFPEGVPVAKENAAYVLCHPILQPDGELTGVLELYKKDENEFYEEDEEIVNSYLVWGGIALHYAELYTNMVRQRKLNNFLLTVVKSIFQDMVSMDTVIVKIMMFAQKLVNADRASLFLVDGRSKELYARIFDVSGSQDSANNIKPEASKEIRFPLGTGIAGHVALTGESLNIPDAYDDKRFNRSVDQLTGYTTRTLLCMPIFIRNHVIGVVQMVNKVNGSFTKIDEEAFATFATYCGLALHHAKLYDKIRRSEQKYKVALEILSYHNTCTEEEVERAKQALPANIPDILLDFAFSPYNLTADEKVTSTIHMFSDLFGLHKFDLDCLIRFTLTVKKNYRRVPYHNWTHGFCVANAIYVVIKKARNTFRPLEELSLFVACLCHDLDHRGKTNQFLVNSASPLAAIYTTSTLEHHHFNQTVSILQQEGHNILKNLSSTEYKQVLGNIKHCILATDLAIFFPNKAKMEEIVNAKSFDWNNNEHRLLLEAITMTACDLCASTKPWEQQQDTVRVIFEEFYEQGDIERAQGREPIPMMDRNKESEKPASQVGFLQGICIPCYDLLQKLVPETKSMMDGCLKNLQKWQELANQQANK